MGRVVDAEPDDEDHAHADDRVDGEAPEVDHAQDVDQRQDHSDEDHEAELDVDQQDENDDEDATQGKREITHELNRNDFVGIPGRVHLKWMPTCQQ